MQKRLKRQQQDEKGKARVASVRLSRSRFPSQLNRLAHRKPCMHDPTTRALGSLSPHILCLQQEEERGKKEKKKRNRMFWSDRKSQSRCSSPSRVVDSFLIVFFKKTFPALLIIIIISISSCNHSILLFFEQSWPLHVSLRYHVVSLFCSL